MLQAGNLIGFGAGGAGGAAATLTKTDESTNTSALTTYTFSGLSVGAASADRLIVVLVSAHYASNATRSISSVTIGGNTASLQQVSKNSSYTAVAGIASYVLTSGTTADVVVTFNAGMSDCNVLVVSITGVSGISATAASVDSEGWMGGTIDHTLSLSWTGSAAVVAAASAYTSTQVVAVDTDNSDNNKPGAYQLVSGWQNEGTDGPSLDVVLTSTGETWGLDTCFIAAAFQ